MVQALQLLAVLVRHAVRGSSALHQRGRASRAPEARNASRRQAVGAELRARHVAAGAAGAAQLRLRRGRVARWCGRGMARGGAAHRRRGGVYIRRRNADEPRATGAGTRSRRGRDADAAGALRQLHAVRTVLSVASTALYFWLLRDLR
jgi:hypothetical protein